MIVVAEIAKLTALTNGVAALEADAGRKMLRHRIIRAAEDARQFRESEPGELFMVKTMGNVKCNPARALLEIVDLPTWRWKGFHDQSESLSEQGERIARPFEW